MNSVPMMKERQDGECEDVYSLVQRIKNRDREAFMTVTRIYQKKVYLLAYSFFGNREDALDVVQETFLRLYQKIALFKKGKSFQNWLLQIAKNICIDTYRKNHRKNPVQDVEGNIEEMNSPDCEKSDVHRSLDLKSIFSSCLEKLTERQRLIFLMKHCNQMEYTEIAEILNIAVGTVKSLHAKAVHNLRALTGPYLGRQT